MLYEFAAAREKKSSHSGANGSEEVVKNMKASFFLGFGVGSTREASLNSDFSSSSSSIEVAAGGVVALAVFCFLIDGSTSVFLGGDKMISGYLLVNLGREVMIGSEAVVMVVVVVVQVAVPVGEVGVVKVKMTASGRQRRMAQRRESGLRGNMVSRRG